MGIFLQTKDCERESSVLVMGGGRLKMVQVHAYVCVCMCLSMSVGGE